MEQAETGLQAGQSLALVQRPGHPAGGAQILGVMTQQRLAQIADLLPVDGLGLVQGRGFFQLAFEGFEFAGITHIGTGEISIVNGVFRQLQIMLSQG